jgi:hypothetical protein
MNVNTVNGILRAVVPAAIAYAVGKGWISSSDAADITAALITLGSAAWSVTTNLETKK